MNSGEGGCAAQSRHWTCTDARRPGRTPHTPGHLHGKNLQQLLDNPGARTAPAVTHACRRDGDRWVIGSSIRSERYRYTMWDEAREGEELYDYEKDPRELKNLAKENNSAKVKHDLHRRLQNILRARNAAASEVIA